MPLPYLLSDTMPVGMAKRNESLAAALRIATSVACRAHLLTANPLQFGLALKTGCSH